MKKQTKKIAAGAAAAAAGIAAATAVRHAAKKREQSVQSMVSSGREGERQAYLIGGVLAAQAIMPTTGLFIIVAFWCINKCSKKPLVSMAVGPLGAILVGLIANVLFLLSLYTPAA